MTPCPPAARPTTRRPADRRAFTLVEILVVVLIVGILLSVVAVASVRAVAGARVAATRTTIKKIDEMLSRRAAAFQRALEGRNLAGGGTVESELLKKFEHIPDSPLKKKRLFMKYFGADFGENPKGLYYSGGSAVYDFYPAFAGMESDLGVAERNELQGQGKFNPTLDQAATRSSEMLYWAVVYGPTFGADAVEADSFSSSEVADTDGDGLLEFVDAWGNPLRFYRWPTRLIRPGPPSDPTSQGDPYYPIGPAVDSDGDGVNDRLADDAPAVFLIASLPSYSTVPDESLADPSQRPTTPLGQDGDDELGEVLLNFFGEYRRANSSATVTDVAHQFEQDYHTFNTWHAPLIVSAGPDGDFGLYGPHEGWYGRLAQPMANAAGTGYSEAIQDNVTNLNGQASGTGGQ